MFFDKHLHKVLLTTVSVGAMISGISALANPVDPNVITGDVIISGLGTDQVIVDNGSMRSIVDWDGFSIGTGETTTFNQISNDAAILNRVTGGDISEIYGTLESNGQVYLINESGILIGASGVINTNGFVASTLNVSNTDFLGAGDMIFSQGVEAGGGITIHGKIRSVSGGDIFLLSREIEIGASAEIDANGGYVGLGAGEEILLRPRDNGDGRISIRAGKGKIINRGMIAGVAAELRAAGGNEYALAINNTGVVRATGVSRKNGKIMLTGGGTVRNTGRVVSRKKVVIRSTKRIENKGLVKASDGNNGGEIIFDAPEIVVEAGSILDVSAALGGGRIFVGGGYQGSGVGHDGEVVDISANAQNVVVESGAVLNASATGAGDAGEITVWSDDRTIFAGDIQATAVDGHGGEVEVSGKNTLGITGLTLDLRGSKGAGALLLDPGSFAIFDDALAVGSQLTVAIVAAADPDGPGPIDGDGDGIVAQFDDDDADGGNTTIVNALGDGFISAMLGVTDITISTAINSGNGADEDIIFTAGTRVIWNTVSTAIAGALTSDNATTLELNAASDIHAVDNVIVQNTETGDGTTSVVTGTGGVVFLAGKDINIGSAARDALNTTQGVSIGSEFGQNVFIAGDTDFDRTPDATGDINVIGGDQALNYAQIGYRQNIARGNNTGDDISGAGVSARNGTIEVAAGRDINVTGGTGGVSFAQIGHGGVREFLRTTNFGGPDTLAALDTIASVAAISGDISIDAGRIVNGSIDIDGGKTNDVNGPIAQVSGADHAQIGHGAVLASHDLGPLLFTAGFALTHGNISGNINIFHSDLNLNTAFMASSDGIVDQVMAQVGHGGHILYAGADLVGAEATHGQIQGDIVIDIVGSVNLGSNIAAAAGDDFYRVESQIGHGAHVQMIYDGTLVGTGDSSLDAVHGSIISFTDITGNTDTTNITVTAAEINVIARETTENSGIDAKQIFDNLQRSQIGHGMATVTARLPGIAGAPGLVDPSAVVPVAGQNAQIGGASLGLILADLQSAMPAINFSLFSTAERDALLGFIAANTTAGAPGLVGAFQSFGGPLNISVTENRIAGNIIVIDDMAGMTTGITVEAGITGTLVATTHDVMIARIGHASYADLHSTDGRDEFVGAGGYDGGNISVLQAHILSANIAVSTVLSTEVDNQDIVVRTQIVAGLAAVTDNTAVAQIGHSGDIFALAGDGGASASADRASGDGGDITIVKGTVWDGSLVRDVNGLNPPQVIHSVNNTLIATSSSNQVIVDSDTAAALASADRNNSESQIGHGHRIRVDTGDGGTSTGSATSGGAGGDVLVYQGVDAREYGIDNDQFDDYARGLRGEIRVLGHETDGVDGNFAVDITSDDSSALASTNFNSDYSLVGHGDIIEITTGDGGNGSTGLDTEGDDIAADPLGQIASFGGRGGHIEVNLGRIERVDQKDIDSYGGNSNIRNKADLGDSRAINLDESGNFRLGGVMLIESDIEITARGALNVDAAVNNALSPSNHAISEAVIGHGSRIFADSGDGGDGGTGNFLANSNPVFQSEIAGESFLNYTPGVGTTRGGNGGDILLTAGDITNRAITSRNGDIVFVHETDADRADNAKILIIATDSLGAHLGDSLIVTSAVNGGLSEGPGSDVVANIGHHVRLFGEGGDGGDGGKTNTEFDANGDSLFTNPATGQTDTQDAPNKDGIDETALQAGAVSIQPNSSGGRGGDAFVVNGNINGDIDVRADRRVTIQTTAGHGLFGKVTSTIGHTTNVVAVTQNGGVAGDLYEPGTMGATYDGGIINVNGTQVTANDGASAFAHVLVDGNQDDEFNLTGNGDSNSTAGEDGIAVTPDDIANREGSTIQSINDDLGSFIPVANNSDGIVTWLPDNPDSVIFHDEEADPEFILDDDGTFVQNNENSNRRYAENAGNLGRFGRVVATYDAHDPDADNELTGMNPALFDARTATTDPTLKALQVFVDMDRDGDVDLVDFDRDGRLDIVDVDHDGFMDVIDGRANYVQSASHVQIGSGILNDITGLGVLDYIAVTAVGPMESGELAGWSLDRTLTSRRLLADYNGNKSIGDFTSLVSDFSTSNGGRGGDAYTQVGYSIGDISVATGDHDLNKANSLYISVNLTDDVTGGGGDDFHRASIGHAAWQASDTSANFAQRRSGREGLNASTDIHVSANGGNAAEYATTAQGGRGGNAVVRQGQQRDVNPDINVVINEQDHLVGKIFVNTPNVLGSMAISNDAKRIEINSFVDLDHGENVAVATIGHTAEAFATAGNADIAPLLDGTAQNIGGFGKSDPGGAASDGSSQTEIANGGDGGDALIHQFQVKGTLTVMTGADDGDGTADYSLLLNAENGAAIVPAGPDNIIIAQIGHGRRAVAVGGDGNDGDDGQWQGNGGVGGDATIMQEAIIDTGITVDLVEYDGTLGTSDPNGYFGNGMKVTASVFENSEIIARAQVGHGDLARADSGNGGNGSPEWDVNEQRNQSANGGDAGDAFIHQTAYAYDITLDIGFNSTGAPALDIVSSAANVNTGADNHILATVGHGGLGVATSGNGGNGGLSGAVNGIQTLADPNLVDSDYNYVGAQTDGDTPYAIDTANRFVLGTLRRGGEGGDAEVNLNVDGTGRVIVGRGAFNDYGINDGNGAGISIHTNDEAVAGAMLPAPGFDGIRIRTENGPGSNQDAAGYLNSALVGHHGFADSVAGVGGNGIQSGLSAQISEGDGGDGGTAITKIEQIWGDISITNFNNIGNNLLDDGGPGLPTNIIIETVSGTPSDSAQHRGEARVGHLTHVAAISGAGGNASKEAGSPPSFPATISAQGGDGGDALTFQGQLQGDITLNAENSIIVRAIDTTVGLQMQVAAIGHRMEALARAADGGFGGTANAETQDQSIYFTYEALREFHARRVAGGSDDGAFDALSNFEKQLVAPFTDYFENKPGELEIFLNKLIGENANVIAANARDDDFVTASMTPNTTFTIPTLVDGTGHITGAQDGEVETMLHIIAASGHGGNAASVQGSVGLDELTNDELLASGNIFLTANAFDTADADRGIILLAAANAIGLSMEIAHVGHQGEVTEVTGGNGENLIGANADANGIGGDGGDAIIDQYALNGSISFNSNHKISIRAQDNSSATHEVRAWVGHRLTIGPDFTAYRLPVTVTAGNGGSESNDTFDDGRNGNGGDVFIWQRGVISGTQRAVAPLVLPIQYDTEILLAALSDADDDQSIIITAEAVTPASPDVETHIGHDFLIHAVKAGDAGRQGALTGPVGASEGLLEGNGGDIFITQSDLGADVDIAGRDSVEVITNSVLGGNLAHLIIGHERTIGDSSDSDNTRFGLIIAGFGGDSHIEDVNGTAFASIDAAAAGIIEDADSGRIEIVLGKIGDSFEDNGLGADDGTERLVTITSITENVVVSSSAFTASTSIIEIGNQQHVVGQTQSASEYTGVPLVQTAGDAGGIYLARDDIYGDILIQALDDDRASSLNTALGKSVVIDTTSGAGATAVTQIGHETEFAITTSVSVTSRAAFGEDRSFLFLTNLTDFTGNLDPAGSDGPVGQPDATLRDAQNAVEDMENLLAAMDLALGNADRFPADDGVLDFNDRGDLQILRDTNVLLLTAARNALNIIDASIPASVAASVNNVQSFATNFISNLVVFQTTLDSIPQAGEQIADFAEAGDIVYGDLAGKFLSIVPVRTIRSVMNMGTLTAEGIEVSDTGVVRGNIDLLSGRYSGQAMVNNVINDETIIADNFGGLGFTTADDLDDGVVQITASSNSSALTEVGHRRVMFNRTSFGGGDTNAASEEGGVAGDGGSITTKNFTRGDIRVRAEEVVIHVGGAAGTGEVHLLHSSLTQNYATGWSDIQTLLGNGGDITNSTVVSGGVDIAAERIASSADSQDRTLQAAGLANTFMHFGHQVTDDNVSNSDPNEAGSTGDTRDNLGSNRGGQITSTQVVTGDVNDDLVTINLDVNGDGVVSDLIIETVGAGQSDIRFGNGEDEGTLAGSIFHRGVSGGQEGKPAPGSPIRITDDGDTVYLSQAVSGDIQISNVEDLEIKALGSADNDIWIGHDAEQFGQSGEVNDGSQYGERVTVNQMVTGEIQFTPTSTFYGQIGSTAGNDWHIGHEATQTALSAGDSANPSDFEDVNNDGIADGNGVSSDGVNDSFTQPDVLATQLVQAKISIVTGEITLQNDGPDGPGRLQVGHEAFHIASTDGDLQDANSDSAGHVVATSQINPGSPKDDDDIIFTATGATGQVDTVVVHVNGSEGDIQLVNVANGLLQVGHSSTSTMSDGVPNAEGQYNTLQAIGNSDDLLDAMGAAGADGEVDDTSQSTIVFTAAQDITISSAGVGTTQVGHFITETGTLQTLPADVDGNPATGLAAGDSELRQIVGSDIIIGDKTAQGMGGTGADGAGNNFSLFASAGGGRAMVGHMSPDDNQWQVESTAPTGRRVTVQLLDGDITIEAGTDADMDAPDGAVLASAVAAIGDETGTGDDINIVAAAGAVARIGHNQAGGTEGVNNETQASAGDIFVRAGGDLHVVGGAIGHENYDFANAPGAATHPDNALPDSVIRNRIRGNTTIGAGQNSADEDSTLIADVLVFDGGPQAVEINSGYGGQGDADVDGELRFFLPAQEGLTIVNAVTFNDSVSNGDPVGADRTAVASNVFAGTGGTDHEHPFEFMDETAPYTDTFVGLGNFTFYFEEEDAAAAAPEYTPYINILDFGNGYEVIFTDPQSGGVVNIGVLGGPQYFGTSSFEVACEEQAAAQGLGADLCDQIRERYLGQPQGIGSHTQFSATAGGNENFSGNFDSEFFEQEGGANFIGAQIEDEIFDTSFAISTPVSHPVLDVSRQKVWTELSGLRNIDIVITKRQDVAAYTGGVIGIHSSGLDDTYGEYIEGDVVNALQLNKTYPNALASASSYAVFENRIVIQ